MIKLLVSVILIFALTGCVSSKPRTAKQQCALDRYLYTSGSAGFGLGNVSKAKYEFNRQNPQCK